MFGNLIAIGLFVLVAWVFISGGGAKKRPGTWSGDTLDEQARRNTRTDSNYRGYDHWIDNRSDRGW